MPSFTYKALTELEAVNQMLGAISESPISSLDITGDLNVSVARQMLYDTSREIQNVGWNFNTEVEYPLALTAEGWVNVPTNVLDFKLSRQYSYRDVTRRGDRLYDKENRTYVFTSTLKADMTLFLEWENLPQPAKQYIAVVASRRFQARMQGDDFMEKVTAEDEFRAKAQFEDSDANESRHNMKNSPDMQQFLRRW